MGSDFMIFATCTPPGWLSRHVDQRRSRHGTRANLDNAGPIHPTRRRRSPTSRKWHTATVYAITDLTWNQIRADHLAETIRGHWSIENRLHGIRDVVFAEDHSQVRTRGSATTGSLASRQRCETAGRPGSNPALPTRRQRLPRRADDPDVALFIVAEGQLY